MFPAHRRPHHAGLVQSPGRICSIVDVRSKTFRCLKPPFSSPLIAPGRATARHAALLPPREQKTGMTSHCSVLFQPRCTDSSAILAVRQDCQNRQTLSPVQPASIVMPVRIPACQSLLFGKAPDGSPCGVPAITFSSPLPPQPAVSPGPKPAWSRTHSHWMQVTPHRDKTAVSWLDPLCLWFTAGQWP